MKTIQVSSFKTSSFRSEFDSIQTIEIEEADFDRGSYGKIYACQKINGKTISRRQAIKILVDDGGGSSGDGLKTIVSLQEQIREITPAWQKEHNKPVNQVTALAALPQFSFEGMLEGQPVMGYAADMLEGEYLLFEKLFNDEDKEKRKKRLKHFYNELPASLRLKFAYDLVEAFKVLQDLSYIHADLNPKNFFINIAQKKLCIIDYDSGAVIKTKDSEAITFGKLGEWLAPETQNQLVENASGNITVNMHTDIWSVAIGIHFMLFHFHPFFFLQVRGEQDMKAYFSKYKWPDIREDDPNFKTSAKALYTKYLAQLKKEVPGSIEEGFRVTFNDGFYSPYRRLSYAQWKTRLVKLMGRAEIKEFKPDKDMVMTGLPVVLTWQADRVHKLVIDHGVGDVTNEKEVIVKPETNTTYTLTAIGHFGEVKRTASVVVLPIPQMQVLKAPMPDMNQAITIDLSRMPTVNRPVMMKIDNLKLPSFKGSFTRPGIFLQEAGKVYEQATKQFGMSGIFNFFKEKINSHFKT